MIYHNPSKQVRIKLEVIKLLEELGIEDINDYLFQKLMQDKIDKTNYKKK